MDIGSRPSIQTWIGKCVEESVCMYRKMRWSRRPERRLPDSLLFIQVVPGMGHYWKLLPSASEDEAGARGWEAT